MDIKCSNKHIRNTIFEKRKISPRGKAFWNSIFNDIDWQRAWLLPYKFCITNKMKQFHIKILHNIRICNKFVFIYCSTTAHVHLPFGLRLKDIYCVKLK